MATHSSTLAWKIPWTEQPGRLQSRGSRRVGHNWVTSLSLFTFMHWRRKWQLTPVFLPEESKGRRSLVGCCLWGCRVGHDWSNLAAAAFNSEKAMATHSSTLAWKIPWMEEPGRLQSVGLWRVGHDWVTDLIWSDMIWYLSFSFWLSSLCMIGSRSSTSTELTQTCSFLWLSNSPLCIYTTTSLSIPLSMDL